jgi:pSer/pThr/pTyr-binding forkhead associated (FHA) protein
MPPQLMALTEGPSIMLDKPILLVGRHQECDIQIPSRKISRRHCCIAQVNDHLVVRDLSSTNGIRINGIRVLEGQLKGGDELTIGNLCYQVRMDDQEPPKKEEMRQTPLPEGDPMESCEEPVPLAEPQPETGSPRAQPMIPPLFLPDDLKMDASKEMPFQQPPPGPGA